jgi:hypothetical protein
MQSTMPFCSRWGINNVRSPMSFIALAVLALAVVPAHADELTFFLNSYVGYGEATSVNPSGSAGFCVSSNCVLFTGTLTDNDVDPSPDTNPSNLLIFSPYTSAADSVTFDGALMLDNTAPLSDLSGDTNYATDGLLNPPNTYSGPIFGIDIPVGTPVGVYVDAVNLDIFPTNGNSPFTVSADVTVVVAPEPAAAGLLLGGLAVLAGVKRKWRSFAASR